MKISCRPSKKKTVSNNYILGSGNEIIDSALEKTRGLLPYQETVMNLFAKVVGIDFGEAESIRKGIGKKDYEVLAKEEERFITTGIANGIPVAVLQDYWAKIVANVGYSFNKSHAVAYSVLTYHCLYYLYKYPAHFLAEWMNSHPEENEKGLMLATLWGIEISLPHVNNSRPRYTAIDNTIYLPFGIIHGVGKKIQDAIEMNKPYASLRDFYEKTGGTVPRKMRALLYILGTFSGVPGTYEDLKTDLKIEKDHQGVWLRNYYKKKEVDGTYRLREEVFVGNKINIFDNFFGGVILPNKRLADTMRSLYQEGYKIARIKKITKGMTSGYGGKTPRERTEVFFSDKWADLYIGSWQYPAMQKLPDLCVGDLIAYKQNNNYGGKYVLDGDNGVEIKILTGEI